MFVLRASTKRLRLQAFISGNVELEQNMNFVKLLAFPRKPFSEKVLHILLKQSMLCRTWLRPHLSSTELKYIFLNRTNVLNQYLMCFSYTDFTWAELYLTFYAFIKETTTKKCLETLFLVKWAQLFAVHGLQVHGVWETCSGVLTGSWWIKDSASYQQIPGSPLRGSACKGRSGIGECLWEPCGANPEFLLGLSGPARSFPSLHPASKTQQ